MTLDEAIRHCEEVAEQNETQAEKIGRQFIGSAMDKYATACRECAADHRQLAEWLTELKEAKRLLKAAVEDLNSIHRVLEDNDILCAKYIACKGCPFNGKNCDKWRYANEALKLIGGKENGET